MTDLKYENSLGTINLKVKFAIGITITTLLMITNISSIVHALFPYERYHHSLEDRCNMYNERFNRYNHFYPNNDFYNHEHYLPDYMDSHNQGLIDCGPKEISKTIDQSQKESNITDTKNNSTANKDLYSHSFRYQSGWEDGCTDKKTGSNNHEHFYNHNNYNHHSINYTKGYNHGLIDCGPKEISKTIDQSQKESNITDTKNNSTANNITANNITANNITANNNTIVKSSNNQGQINNQKVICIVTIGNCNVTSGQAQSK